MTADDGDVARQERGQVRAEKCKKMARKIGQYLVL